MFISCNLPLIKCVTNSQNVNMAGITEENNTGNELFPRWLCCTLFNLSASLLYSPSKFLVDANLLGKS